MRQLKFFRWAAALTLAIALAPGAASAQEADTLTISSTFSMTSLGGTVGDDLLEAYANGHDHTWTLTLHGTSQSHSTFSSFGVTNRATEIHATSFDLEFSGPDAATLNGIVSDHIAGGEVLIYLRNAYSAFGDFVIFYVWPSGPDVEFFAGVETYGPDTLFPTDADGYPVVGPDPFSIWTEYSALFDRRPGNDGGIGSQESLVTFEGSVGPLPGDFNGDDIVDAADYVVWRKNFGTQTSYDVWRAHFGQTAGSGSSTVANTTVPEPTTLVMLIVATVGIRLRRRHIASECRKLNSA